MKKILPFLALLLLFAACEKEPDANTSDTAEQHTYHHSCFVISVNVDQMGSLYQNLVTESALGCKIYYGQECLVKLDTIRQMLNNRRCFIDTIQFSELPYYETLSLRYSLPNSYEPENMPCCISLVVSGKGWKVDTDGNVYGEFAPTARVLSKTYFPGEFSLDQLRHDLDAFNVSGPWVTVE